MSQAVFLRAADASQLIKFSSAVEITAAEGESKLPTFKIVAYTGVPMNVDSFYSPVVLELSGIKASRSKIPILLDHDPSRIIGQGSVEIDSASVRISGSIMGQDADALKVATLAKNGFDWQASVGASITRREFLEAGKKAIVNGREVVGPLMIARESILKETSFVAMGADGQTSAAVAASLSPGKGTAMNFEAWLQAKGFDPAVLSDTQKSLLKATFDREMNPPPVAPPVAPLVPPVAPVLAGNFHELQASLDETRLEQTRRQAISAIAKRFMTEYPHRCEEIAARAQVAIEGKGAPSDLELDLLRETRNEGSVIATRRRSSAPEYTDRVIECAIAQATKLKKVENLFDEQTLEAADKLFRGGIGLQQLLHIGAKGNGHDSYSVKSDIENVLEAAFPRRGERREIHASGASSISLPNILSNYANKAIIDAFNAVEAAWRLVSEIRPLSDFKQITIHSLTGDLELEKVGPNGELKYGSLGEEVYTLQAETYGKILAISRKDIINDDLGAFAAVPRKLGRGSALKINTVFWTEYLDNSTFFTSGRGNYDDGTDTALDAAGLKAAMAIWDALTDPDGKPLGSSPRFILVPPGQWEPAMALMHSTTVNTGGSASTTKVPNGNVWAGMFEVVKSRYLSSSAFTGYSAMAWYLLCDPADIPVISTGFLNGKEMPYVETAQADFDQLGVKMRAYHDFGVRKQEYRGGCKFKGEA